MGELEKMKKSKIKVDCRIWLVILYVVFLGFQAAAWIQLGAFGHIDSQYDVEFKCYSHWGISVGTGSDKEYCDEYVDAHYKIKYNGSIGQVTVITSWRYISGDEDGTDYESKGDDYYRFTYSLETLEYLSGQDQDFYDQFDDEKNGPGMKVWFYTTIRENTENGDNLSILGRNYQFSGKGTMWIGHVSCEGSKVECTWSSFREDFPDKYYITTHDRLMYNREGWVIGRSITDEITKTGSVFDTPESYTSYTSMEVKAATYEIPIVVMPMILSYWVPFPIFLFILYPVFNRILSMIKKRIVNEDQSTTEA